MPKQDPSALIIKNGNRMREWLVFAGSIIGMIVTATLIWATLTGRVSNLERDSEKIHREGTLLSQQNCRDIIAIKADVKYTRQAVDRVDRKLESIGSRI